VYFMFEIDGSQKSGSGTILRNSVALSALTGQPLHISNIRQSRPQPGLKPQHLEAVLTAGKLCNAELKGATLGSRELYFKPKQIMGGSYEAEIGTAGSIPMLIMTVLPICVFANKAVKLYISKGGTDTTHAPTVNYLRNVLFRALKSFGVEAEIVVHRYGYYPKGMGEATLTVQPTGQLQPICLESFGEVTNVEGISVCTFLAEKHVAERQAKAATEFLNSKGYRSNIEVVNDSSNVFQKGSSIALWVQTTSGVILGADAIGDLGKSSEVVGKEAAQKLCIELNVKPTVDVHLADMLIPFMALTKGVSSYLASAFSEHMESNIWLAERMLNAKFDVKKTGELYRVEKFAQ
jgi:RNA 3'-phosphate cyclase